MIPVFRRTKHVSVVLKYKAAGRGMQSVFVSHAGCYFIYETSFVRGNFI